MTIVQIFSKLTTINGYASFRKAHNGEQKVIANKAQNAFYSSNENAIYIIITSKFTFKFSGTVWQNSNPFFANSLYQRLALRLLW